ncbi:MAG: WD40 repeat domain-containing protein, partial [Bacteroidetes bacterium]
SLLTLCLFALLSLPLAAQPDTDIYLLDIQAQGNSWTFSNPLNITPRRGYDNQPAFTPDGRAMLYVSAQSDGQTDIFRYTFRSGTSSRLTQTRDRSEYSPTVMPDGVHVSAVVVEPDSSQRLWAYPLQDGRPRLLTKKIDRIGYYAWYSKKDLALFRVGDPPTLEVARSRHKRTRTLARDVGRAVQRIPGPEAAISYVAPGPDSLSYIYRWDPKSGESTPIVATLPGMQDYCWSSEGYLLMGLDDQLYIFHPGTDRQWLPVGHPGVGHFYRLAISPDGRRLAVVVYKGEMP